jgi:hypothetical protein
MKAGLAGSSRRCPTGMIIAFSVQGVG